MENPYATPRTKASRLLRCKCSNTNKEFCIRLDRQINEKEWHMAYSFPLRKTMVFENFMNNENEILYITNNTHDFNGCPYCFNLTMNFCKCGGIFCAEGNGIGIFKCPICKQKNQFGNYGNIYKVKSSTY